MLWVSGQDIPASIELPYEGLHANIVIDSLEEIYQHFGDHGIIPRLSWVSMRGARNKLLMESLCILGV